ncbi:hypothetical protein Trco_001369 [Trichoderma cornu-damae]|uniref:Uncharacterized protein n=1 Tax=Trichoderma cornu-damae TaxID=654480 RepID=A0A9P8U171_9HYPO|nr:hypothetical protein Trco_001369 [Trichoderma cornu-damae]
MAAFATSVDASVSMVDFARSGYNIVSRPSTGPGSGSSSGSTSSSNGRCERGILCSYLLFKHHSENIFHIARLASARDARQAVRRIPQVLGRHHGIGLDFCVLRPRFRQKLLQVAPAFRQQLGLACRHAQQVLQVDGHLRHPRKGVDHGLGQRMNSSRVLALRGRAQAGLLARYCGYWGWPQLGGPFAYTLAESVQQAFECRRLDRVSLVDHDEMRFGGGGDVQRFLVVQDERTRRPRLDRRQNHDNIRVLRLLLRPADSLQLHGPDRARRARRPWSATARPESGRVCEGAQVPSNVEAGLHNVPRRAGFARHNRRLAPDDQVHQRALAYVWRPQQGDPDAAPQQLAPLAALLVQANAPEDAIYQFRHVAQQIRGRLVEVLIL